MTAAPLTQSDDDVHPLDDGPGTGTAADVAVRTTAVGKRYRHVHALDDVSFAVPTDSITGLLGRNGAGKTTLMSVLTGQEFRSSGSVEVFGADPVENDAVLSQTCFIRESQTYPNNFKVSHVLAVGSDFHPHWDADLAGTLVDEFQLPRNRQVQKLSRGMTSALGIVIGLASRAPLTIFDEPYLGLDATARQQFYDVLLRDYADHPRTIILSTHLIDEVADLLEYALVLDRGRLVLDGPTDELCRRASVLTGPADRVAEATAGREVLHTQRIGGFVASTVNATYDRGERARLHDAGVEVGPISLQDLVIRVGLFEGADRPDPHSHSHPEER